MAAVRKIAEEEWNLHKDDIVHLYKSRSLDEVKTFMESDKGFQARLAKAPFSVLGAHLTMV
jgi:hypothetical protein